MHLQVSARPAPQGGPPGAVLPVPLPGGVGVGFLIWLQFSIRKTPWLLGLVNAPPRPLRLVTDPQIFNTALNDPPAAKAGNRPLNL